MGLTPTWNCDGNRSEYRRQHGGLKNHLSRLTVDLGEPGPGPDQFRALIQVAQAPPGKGNSRPLSSLEHAHRPRPEEQEQSHPPPPRRGRQPEQDAYESPHQKRTHPEPETPPSFPGPDVRNAVDPLGCFHGRPLSYQSPDTFSRRNGVLGGSVRALIAPLVRVGLPD